MSNFRVCRWALLPAINTIVRKRRRSCCRYYQLIQKRLRVLGAMDLLNRRKWKVGKAMRSSSLAPPHRLYSKLGLLPQAKDEEIREAYYSLAKRFHPDLQSTDPGAEETFKSISQAATMLRHPARRRLYDLGIIDEAGNANAPAQHGLHAIHFYIVRASCFLIGAAATAIWIFLRPH